MGDCEAAREYWGIDVACDPVDHSDTANLVEVGCCEYDRHLVCRSVAEVAEFVTDAVPRPLVKFMEFEAGQLRSLTFMIDSIGASMTRLPLMLVADPEAWGWAEGIEYLGELGDPDTGASLRNRQTHGNESATAATSGLLGEQGRTI